MKHSILIAGFLLLCEGMWKFTATKLFTISNEMWEESNGEWCNSDFDGMIKHAHESAHQGDEKREEKDNDLHGNEEIKLNLNLIEF